MSSVRSFVAQPKSRRLVCTQDYNQASERGPYFFPRENIDSWAANNTDSVTKVSASVYIVKNGYDFADTVNNLDANGSIDGRRTFVDLGKSLHIGNSTSSDLIVLQLVEVYGLSVNGGLSGATGYIVVENNTLDAGYSGDAGRFLVRVARV